MNLLLGYYTDGLSAHTLARPLIKAYPACPPRFAFELQRLAHIYAQSGVPSIIVTVQFHERALAQDLPQQILRLKRELDEVWLLPAKSVRPYRCSCRWEMPARQKATSPDWKAGYKTKIAKTLSQAGVFAHVVTLDSSATCTPWQKFTPSPMLNLKLGLSALGLEISAWSTAWWLQERSDGALLSYLALHAGASVLLSLSLLPLVPKRIAQPRWAALLLMIACSYGIPIADFIGVVLAFITLHLYREKLGPVAFDSVQLPEFDQHQKRHSNQHHVGLRSFLGNTQAPLDSRLRAMAALQYVPGRTRLALAAYRTQ